ncbi:MAG: ERF family protein [Hyphomicrobiaceae bacterium]|nr:ERF family protein [Hyphomicrobiaceae bacterium]
MQIAAAVPPTTLLGRIIDVAGRADIDVEKIKQLVDLHKSMQVAEWQRLFNESMVKCQQALDPVRRNKSNSSTNSRYADLAQLAEQALPIIHAHGFAVSFSEAEPRKPDHIGVAVSVRHQGGYTEVSTWNVPQDLCGLKGQVNKTAIHGWGSAITYCRRYSLLASFNIIVSGDDDGQAAGGQKSAAQARRDGKWPILEAKLRSAKSMSELQDIWNEFRFEIKAWPAAWRDCAVAAKEDAKTRLGGTMTALHESLRQLERPEPREADIEQWGGAEPRVTRLRNG